MSRGVVYSFLYSLDVVLIFYEFFKSAPFTYHFLLTMWLNGRWFPKIINTLGTFNMDLNGRLNGRWLCQIVDRDSGNLYQISPPRPCSDF